LLLAVVALADLKLLLVVAVGMAVVVVRADFVAL
jgi:hypothetical protein